MNNRKQSGFSLVELMVALVLGLVVSAAAIQIFASNKNTYRLEGALSRLQENGRFVVDKMIKDLRMAGFNGCLSRGDGVPTQDITPAKFDSSVEFDIFPFAIDGSDSIRGYEYSTGTSQLSPSLDANLNLGGRGIVAGTDVLNIQRADSCAAQLSSAPSSTEFTSDTDLDVVVPNNCSFGVNDVVMVTNCSVADVFQISGISGSALARTVGDISTIYQTESQVFKWLSNAYYIAAGASGEPALFRSSWDSNGDNNINTNDFVVTELADGVEDMQLLYGVDTGVDEYADQYVTADNVTNWEAVRSIRISLLLRSADNITQSPRTVPFNGGNAGGADRRLRTAYTTTVTLRNNTP